MVSVAFIGGDGVVRLDALVEGLVEEIAEAAVCSWCAVEVFRAQSGGRLTWAHRTTGLLVCSGQVVGGWEELRHATPVEWRVAKRTAPGGRRVLRGLQRR
jgi:hypothetical protein